MAITKKTDLNSRTRIYQDKINFNSKTLQLFQEIGELLGKAKREDYLRLTAYGPTPNNRIRKDKLKTNYNIGSYYSINIILENNQQLQLSWRTLKNNQKEWRKDLEYSKKNPKDKRAQYRAQKTQERLDATAKSHTPKITFGGNKLWKEAQKDHKLMTIFKEKRWFFKSIGDKAPHATNRLIRLNDNGELSILVPPALRSKYGLSRNSSRIIIGTVNYRYGWDNIKDAIINQRAITYQLVRTRKQWLLQATLSLPEVPKTNSTGRVLALDTNAGHVDGCVLDEFGNPVKFFTLSVKKHGMAKTVDQLFSIAARNNVDCISIEKLSGLQRNCTRGRGGKINSVVSSIKSGVLKRRLSVGCESRGLEFLEVDPAGTSKKTSEWSDVCVRASSNHQIASYLIGRRSLGYSISRKIRSEDCELDKGQASVPLVFSRNSVLGLGEFQSSSLDEVPF